jgi:hypothetical protein
MIQTDPLPAKSPGRHRYFQLLIFPVIKSDEKTIWKNIQAITTILELSKFITQFSLEMILYRLIIKENNRIIKLEKFSGQLERNLDTGSPLWTIFLQTSSVTTGRKILQALQTDLKDQKLLDVQEIKIRPLPQLPTLKLNSRLILPNTQWFPGYFSKETVLVRDLLQRQDVQQSIKDNREICKDLENLLLDN